MRILRVPLPEVLSIVACAESYGHGNDVLLDALADWTGYSVSDAEIEEYSRESCLSDDARKQGYGEEDYAECIVNLTEWRDRYCTAHTKATEKSDALRERQG